MKLKYSSFGKQILGNGTSSQDFVTKNRLSELKSLSIDSAPNNEDNFGNSSDIFNMNHNGFSDKDIPNLFSSFKL